MASPQQLPTEVVWLLSCRRSRAHPLSSIGRRAEPGREQYSGKKSSLYAEGGGGYRVRFPQDGQIRVRKSESKSLRVPELAPAAPASPTSPLSASGCSASSAVCTARAAGELQSASTRERPKETQQWYIEHWYIEHWYTARGLIGVLPHMASVRLYSRIRRREET